MAMATPHPSPISQKSPTLRPSLLIKIASFLLCFSTISYHHGVLASQYTVGDSSGWNLGVDYKTWASQFTFKTGDTLVFSYGGLHSVLQVSEADYNACSTSNAITTGTGGNTVVKLDKAQTYYFICGVAGHCGSGMQVSIAVSAISSSPSTITTPSSPKTPSSSSTTPSSPTDTSIAPSLTLTSFSWLTIIASLFFYTLPMLP